MREPGASSSRIGLPDPGTDHPGPMTDVGGQVASEAAVLDPIASAESLMVTTLLSCAKPQGSVLRTRS